MIQKVSHFLLYILFAPFLASCGMGICSINGCGDAVGAPTITSVSTSANADGTQTVSISGTGFVVGTTVTVNGNNCTPVTVISSILLRCVLPNTSIAMTNIVITNPNSGGSSGGGSGANAFHTLFISHPGNVGSFGGLAQADALCVTAAASGSKTSSLTGTWRAILSDETTNAKDRITFVSGAAVKSTNGDTIVASGSDLWTGALLAPPAYNQNGLPENSPNGVWTGSNADGTKSSGETCSSWTGGGTGTAGDSGSLSGGWLNGVLGNSCGSGMGGHPPQFYCINSNH